MRKHKRKLSASVAATVVTTSPLAAPKPDASTLLPAPKLRAMLGISPVTLWRWRHDETSGFPSPKVIKGRLYFRLSSVEAWLARQPDQSSASAP